MIAVSAGRSKIVNSLIQRYAQVNAVNHNGQCSLHYAASKNRFEVRKKNSFSFDMFVSCLDFLLLKNLCIFYILSFLHNPKSFFKIKFELI